MIRGFRNSVALLALLLSPSLAAAAGSIDTVIDGMTAEEKIAQLLFVGYSGQVNSAELRMLCSTWRVGGIVLYAHNIESPEQVRRLTQSIGSDAGDGIVPFIAIDQEGGIVHRLGRGAVVIPSAMAIGAANSTDLARRAGREVAMSLRDLGFTMNFAPVLDVLTEPRNAAIGTRAFGSSPERVARLGRAFIEGEQESGVVAVAKHFPGEGGVVGDPHATLPELSLSLRELRRRDLVPFRDAFGHGLMAVMTAHIALPAITGGTRPATLSRAVMTHLLREEMKFRGIAITDALQMDALGRKRDPGALAIEAIRAGADMVLALGGEHDRSSVRDALLAAYRDGRLPRRRIDESVRRVLEVKKWLKGRPPAETGNDAMRGVAAEVARRAVTTIGATSTIVPLRRERIMFVGSPGALQSSLHPAVSVAATPEDGVGAAVATASRLARDSDVIVAAAANEKEFALVEQVHAALPDVPLVFVNLGSPFRRIRCARCAEVLTYADDDDSQRAAADVILGRASAPGSLPVMAAVPPERP